MSNTISSRPILLVGFMGSGKTSVGRSLAQQLGRPFVDLDEMVVSGAGQSVPEIFAEHGESHFRRLEAAALNEVLAGPAAVVATGGGTPCHDRGLQRMREKGLVVHLSAPFEALLVRIEGDGSRPLLAQPKSELRELFDAREPTYRQAHLAVRTEDRTPNDVARIVAGFAGALRELPAYVLPDASIVALERHAYPVLIAPGALGRVGELAWKTLDGCKRVGIVSDSNVAPLYLERVRDSFTREGIDVVTAVVPAGEAAKRFSQFESLCERFVDGGLDRASVVVALGGGVVGDLAGFVAASLFRGVRCIQVPTTLLAMVDSSVGGKTGINIAAGKNLVGAFWQPRFVLSDPEVLDTLPMRERRAGFGELVKYGLLDGPELLGLIEQVAALMQSPAKPSEGAESPGTGRIPGELTEVIRRCAAIKSWIVARDEREETGERALLNLGHTVGHAIEAATGYKQYLHGEAVALGLVATCRVSARLGLCNVQLEERVAATLSRAGLDVEIDKWLKRDVLQRIGVDKKRTGSRVRFVTLSDVGAASLTDIELEELITVLQC